MGSFTFKWEHPAEEVYVTGTFDDWTKSVKLDKEDGIFQKTVDLKDASSKIYYKFVVDNTWTTNESAPKEPDHEGNVNNFLTPEQITPAASAAFINSVGPDSSTVKMAGEQPKTDAATTPSAVPGGFPETPLEDEDKPVSVNPLPAAAGAVNPIKLEPGEKVPESVTTQDVNQNVKLDKESYEKSDALPGVETKTDESSKTVIPEAGIPVSDNTINSVGPGSTTAALAGQVPKEPKPSAEGQDKSAGNAGIAATGVAAAGAAAAGAAGVAVATKDTVVEKTGPAVGQATATVADTANKNLPDGVKEKLPVSAQQAIGSQGKEETREEVSPEVPSEVKESITEAHKSPEAAASTSAVEHKKDMETELLKEVKPATAEGEAKPEEVKAEPKVEDATEASKAPEAETTGAATTEAPAAAANGSGSKPTEASTAEKKKKNRLSAMLSKIKHKITD